MVWAINLTPEFEVRKFDGEETWETELALELTSGLSYRFAPGGSVGWRRAITPNIPTGRTVICANTMPSLPARTCTMAPSAGGGP